MVRQLVLFHCEGKQSQTHSLANLFIKSHSHAGLRPSPTNKVVPPCPLSPPLSALLFPFVLPLYLESSSPAPVRTLWVLTRPSPPRRRCCSLGSSAPRLISEEQRRKQTQSAEHCSRRLKVISVFQRCLEKKKHCFDSWPTFPLLSERCHWLQTDAQMLFKVIFLFFLIIVKTPTKKAIAYFFHCPVSFHYFFVFSFASVFYFCPSPLFMHLILYFQLILLVDLTHSHSTMSMRNLLISS